jgi:uncharacterized protein YkwD
MSLKLKTFFLVFIQFFLFTSFTQVNPSEENPACLSAEEIKLYNLINQYRKSKKLPSIPLSASLTLVAKAHVQDLMDNKPNEGNCNAHSWSKNGKWTSCCYTPDHKESKCMWNKPRELSSYQGDGFEIAYWSSGSIIPENALKSWQGSKGHNSVLINDNPWKSFKWQAVGIAIYKNYTCVWFGMLADPNGEPAKCQ